MWRNGVRRGGVREKGNGEGGCKTSCDAKKMALLTIDVETVLA